MKGKQKDIKIPNVGNNFGMTNNNEPITDVQTGTRNPMIQQTTGTSLVDNTNMEINNSSNKKNKYYIYEELEVLNQCKKYVNFYKWFYYFEEIKLNLDDGVSSFLSHSYNLLLRNRNSKKRNFLMLDCSYMEQKKRQALDDHINRNINNTYYKNIEHMIMNKKPKDSHELNEQQLEVLNHLKDKNIECMLYINDIFDNKRLSILFLLNTKNTKEKTENEGKKDNKKNIESAEENMEICDMIMLRQSHEIISFYKEKILPPTKQTISQTTQNPEHKSKNKVKEKEMDMETYWSPLQQMLKEDETYQNRAQKKDSNHRFKKKSWIAPNNCNVPYQNNKYVYRTGETKNRYNRDWSKVVQKKTYNRKSTKYGTCDYYIKREVYESNDTYKKQESYGNTNKQQTWKNSNKEIVNKKTEEEDEQQQRTFVHARNFKETPKKENEKTTKMEEIKIEKKEVEEEEVEGNEEKKQVNLQINIEKSRYPNMVLWRSILENLTYPKRNVIVDALSVCSGMDGYIQNENFNFDVLINDNYAYLVKYKRRLSIYRLIYAITQLIKDRYMPHIFVPYWWFNHVENCKDRLLEPPDFHIFILNELKNDGILHVGNEKEEILTLTMDEDDVDILTKLAIENEAILCTNNDDLIKYYFNIHSKARVSKFISRGSFFILTNFL